MVKLLKLGKSEEEIKDLENREGKLNKKPSNGIYF